MAANTLNFGSKVVFANGTPLTLPIAASDPGSAVAGDLYYNSVSNLVRAYNGTSWVNTNDGGNANLLTGSTLAANVLSSSLTSVGTLTSGTWNATTIAINHGGTGATSAAAAYANLSPLTTAGDIIYENSTPAPARLPIGSSGQILTVVGGLPAWATSSGGTVTTVSVTSANGFAGTVANATTTPAITISTTINSPVLAGNGTAISAASTTGTGSTVVLSASPTLTGTLSAAAVSLSAALNMNSNLINNVSSPINPLDAANKTYVDNLVQGLNWKQTTRSATTAALPANTYNNGTAGVGATLTGNSNGALPAQDGVTLVASDRLLVKNEASAINNGIYVVTQVGSGGTPYILTRATDSDTPAKLQWATVEIGADASVQAGEIWRESDDITAIGTDPVAFTQVSQGTAYVFTSGVQLSGNTVSANVDNSTIDVNGSNQIEVKSGGITNTQVSASAAIAYSKLNLSNSIVNADINTSAAIAFSKLAALTSAHILVGNGSNVATDVAVSGDLTLANTGAFTVAKIQGTTVSGTTGSGNVVFSASPTLTGTLTAAAANFSGALGANGGITSTGALTLNANGGASAFQIEALNVQRSTNGSNYVTETYTDSTTLTDNSGPTAAFSFAFASVAGEEICYVIENGASPSLTRVGTIRVTCSSDGSNASLSDVYSESSDAGVTWSAVLNGSNIDIKYTAANQGSNRTMRSDIKSFRR